MSLYGYEIVQTLIVDVEPDDQVKSSMNEINTGMPAYLQNFTGSFFWPPNILEENWKRAPFYKIYCPTFCVLD